MSNLSAIKAIALLQDPREINLEGLVDVLRARYPDQAWSLIADAGTKRIRCGEQAVVLVTDDWPQALASGVVERAEAFSPGVAEDLKRHRAIAFVALTDDDASRLDQARIVTAVVAGLIAVLGNVCGVLVNGIVARSPTMWLERSQSAFAPYPNYPFLLWVDLVPIEQTPDALVAATMGLTAFQGREIEFEVPGITGHTALKHLGGATGYVLQHGDQIKDGQTIGSTASERFEIRERTSRFFVGPVLRIGPDLPGGLFKAYDLIPAEMARHYSVLQTLGKLGLFNPTDPANRVALQPSRYESEQRLESYDSGIKDALSHIEDTDQPAAQNALQLLAQGNAQAAREAMIPTSDQLRHLLATMKFALMKGDLFMFIPKQSAAKPWYLRWLGG
ncbi:DUF4261 domain-containing protein [Bradyrhizobium sp. HKCCYLS2038]|uniref:DUF4261 domain-containing protein n=1 Tax=unclassified Bradyrhizobium TaxID=2631580 RepID=UPI003EBA80C8